MAGGSGRWTPTQKRMLEVLSDGGWHPTSELFACLGDELAGSTAVPFHVSVIRKRLEPWSQGIATMRFAGGLYYQHVRMIAGSDS